MPGGGMEWGERPEDTAARELEEEAGLQARLGTVAGVYSHWLDADEAVLREPGHVLGIVFRGSAPSRSPPTTFDVGTTDAAAWLTLRDAADLPGPAAARRRRRAARPERDGLAGGSMTRPRLVSPELRRRRTRARRR